jgi:hypothetical protein
VGEGCSSSPINKALGSIPSTAKMNEWMNEWMNCTYVFLSIAKKERSIFWRGCNIFDKSICSPCKILIIPLIKIYGSLLKVLESFIFSRVFHRPLISLSTVLSFTSFFFFDFSNSNVNLFTFQNLVCKWFFLWSQQFSNTTYVLPLCNS